MRFACLVVMLAVLIAGCSTTEEPTVQTMLGAEDLELGKTYVVNEVIFTQMMGAGYVMELAYSSNYEEKEEIYLVPTNDKKAAKLPIGCAIQFTKLEMKPNLLTEKKILTNFEFKLIWPNY